MLSYLNAGVTALENWERSERIGFSERISSIDAARGTAMLFACLAHFTDSYFFPIGEEKIGDVLVTIGMVASPTFVTVSGLVAGFLYATSRHSFDDLQRKLFDRGLFLLIVGHLLLTLTGFAAGSSFVQAYRIEYITDAIAFAIMIGPSLLRILSPSWRVILAVAVFAIDWLAVLFWQPNPGFGDLVKTYLVGVVSPEGWGGTSGGFAIFSWFSVYLVGTVIGQRIGAYYAAKSKLAAHVFLAKVGSISVALALMAKACLVLLRRLPTLAAHFPNFIHVLSPYQKFPPGPVYLAFFGGTGMLLIAAVLEAERRRVAALFLKPLRQIGQASFVVYMVQFYLYSVALRRLQLAYTHLWPLVFLAGIIILAAVATLWNRKAGNELLTVGAGVLLKKIARNKQRIIKKPLLVEIRTS